MMHVACIADRNYWRHTGAMLHSLLTHNAGEGVTIHVLHGESAPEPERQRLAQVAAPFKATLRFVPVPAGHGARSTSPYFPDCVWYRIFLPELLPQLDKILYLDSDILVLESLRALWDTDISQHSLGAITNPLPRTFRDYPTAQLGIDPADYFNSGVLLMNLRRLRAEDARAHLLDYAGQHPANTCPDQDALSVLFHGSRLRLHPRWNLQTALLHLEPTQTPLPPNEVRQARSAPAIVHFSGPFKPWMYLCREPWRERFLEHARQTPWPEQPLQGKTLASAVLRRLPAAWIWRYFAFRRWLRR